MCEADDDVLESSMLENVDTRCALASENKDPSSQRQEHSMFLHFCTRTTHKLYFILLETACF